MSSRRRSLRPKAALAGPARPRSRGRDGACSVAVRLAACTACLGVAACTEADDVAACPETAARTPHEVTYRLRWHDGGSSDGGSAGSEGGGDAVSELGPLTLATDLGYSVTVERGELTSYSAQLVACTTEELAILAPDALACGPTSEPAHAALGHGTGEHDTSAVKVVAVEPLLGPGLDFGSALADSSQYCRAHYLAGPVTSATDGGVFGLTLWLEGSYRAPGAAVDTPFALATKSAYGGFFALGRGGDDAQSEGPESVAYDSGHSAAEVVITRPRGAMFDGIALDTTSPEEAGLAVLRTLVKQSRTTILF